MGLRYNYIPSTLFWYIFTLWLKKVPDSVSILLHLFSSYL